MTIEALPFEHRPRNSIANNLDKINELIDWVNLDTHLYASASGERVTVDDASSVKGLTVDGRSVQNGTPTPDAPVEVQVVRGRNLCIPLAAPATQSGLTFTPQSDGSIRVTGSPTGMATVFLSTEYEIQAGTTLTLSGCPTGGGMSTYRLDMYKTEDAIEASDYGNSVTKAISGAVNRVRVTVYSGAGSNVDITFRPQLELGSQATPYVPHGSIGIVVGNTVTPIDLQGNTLASLPDGTRDELHVDSAGHVWIEKRVGHTTQAVTDGVTGTVGTDVLSSTGQIADGADVWYKLATTHTIDLGYIDPPAIPSGSVMTVSASLTPEFHLEWWVDDGITALVDDLIAYIDYKTEG